MMIPSEMNAFRVTGIESASLETTPIPLSVADETLCRVLACGICKTDAKIFMVGQRDLSLPRIPGHELVVEDCKTAQRYVVFPGVPCGQCSFCQTGMENLCPSIDIFGFSKEGGFAEFISVPTNCLLPIPHTLPSEIATFAEPLGCCVNALSRMNIKEESEILILGGGFMGLLLAYAARKYNLQPRIYDTNPTVRKEASRAAEIMQLSFCEKEPMPLSMDAVIAATANPDAVIMAFSILHSNGHFCHFSGMGHKGDIPGNVFDLIHYKQLHVSGAYGCTRAQMETALKWIETDAEPLAVLAKGPVSLSELFTVLPQVWKGSSFRYIVRP